MEDARQRTAPKSLETTQHGGSHYKQFEIEPAEYNHRNKIPFCAAEAIKYLSRHGFKNGIEDVKKAMHYCQMILDLDYNVSSDVTYGMEPIEIMGDDISGHKATISVTITKSSRQPEPEPAAEEQDFITHHPVTLNYKDHAIQIPVRFQLEAMQQFRESNGLKVKDEIFSILHKHMSLEMPKAITSLLNAELGTNHATPDIFEQRSPLEPLLPEDDGLPVVTIEPTQVEKDAKVWNENLHGIVKSNIQDTLSDIQESQEDDGLEYLDQEDDARADPCRPDSAQLLNSDGKGLITEFGVRNYRGSVPGPIQPGSLQIKLPSIIAGADTMHLTDDCHGNVVGDVDTTYVVSPTHRINYESGEMCFVLAENPDEDIPIVALFEALPQSEALDATN